MADKWTFNDFKQCSAALDNLCEVKDNEYGRSYAKRGLIRGCMANIDRKYDRLDEQVQGAVVTSMEDKEVEAMLESLGDLRNYCQLMIMFLKEHRPVAYEEWKQKQIQLAEG